MDAGVDPERISVVYDGVPHPGGARKTEERMRVLALDTDDPGQREEDRRTGRRVGGHGRSFFTRILGRDFPEAALFVYITDLEGLGSAVLLAMANGVPVLASRVGGLPEIVEDGVKGLLTSNEPETIARSIQRLLADRTLASLLAARASGSRGAGVFGRTDGK